MKWVFFIIILLTVTTVGAFRIPRPLLLSHPLDQAQINTLNDALENLWNLQNGEFNLDTVSTAKTQADVGDIWLIQTGAVVRLQYNGGGHVFTLTPDGF